MCSKWCQFCPNDSLIRHKFITHVQAPQHVGEAQGWQFKDRTCETMMQLDFQRIHGTVVSRMQTVSDSELWFGGTWKAKTLMRTMNSVSKNLNFTLVCSVACTMLTCKEGAFPQSFSHTRKPDISLVTCVTSFQPGEILDYRIQGRVSLIEIRLDKLAKSATWAHMPNPTPPRALHTMLCSCQGRHSPDDRDTIPIVKRIATLSTGLLWSSSVKRQLACESRDACVAGSWLDHHFLVQFSSSIIILRYFEDCKSHLDPCLSRESLSQSLPRGYFTLCHFCVSTALVASFVPF